MKMFIVGDFKGNTGPASVNKLIRKYMPKETEFSLEESMSKRIIEIFIKSYKSDVVIFSGMSKVNIIGLIFCKIFRKKSAYLMHGSVSYERELNNNQNILATISENLVLFISPKIICVSESFLQWFKSKNEKYGNKSYFINNGIEWDINTTSNIFKKNRYQIMSVGGGRPLKKIKYVCKAIEYLNTQEGYNIEFLVVGGNGQDTEEIRNFDFVEYIESVPKHKMNCYYRKSAIYIQNSLFETFGLAPIEALQQGCTLLISKNVGSISIIKDIKPSDIIDNPENFLEIANKIKYIINNGNNRRLLESIDKNDSSMESYINYLFKIFEEK